MHCAKWMASLDGATVLILSELQQQQQFIAFASFAFVRFAHSFHLRSAAAAFSERVRTELLLFTC